MMVLHGDRANPYPQWTAEPSGFEQEQGATS
jgi:hypothetical protein